VVRGVLRAWLADPSDAHCYLLPNLDPDAKPGEGGRADGPAVASAAAWAAAVQEAACKRHLVRAGPARIQQLRCSGECRGMRCSPHAQRSTACSIPSMHWDSGAGSPSLLAIAHIESLCCIDRTACRLVSGRCITDEHGGRTRSTGPSAALAWLQTYHCFGLM